MNKFNSVFSHVSSSWITLCIIGSLFFAPMSSSLQSIFLVLTLIFVCIKTTPTQFLPLLSSKWFLCALGLFLLSVAGCLWTGASYHDALVSVGKYSKLLFLPILVMGFQEPKNRHLAIHAFLIAMLITCMISFLKMIDWSHYHGDDPGYVFRNHIITGYMMTFAAYLSALYMVKAKGNLRFFYLILITLFSYQVLFISMGRTSYITYFLLMILFVSQIFSWQKLCIALCLICTLFGVIYHESSIMQHLAHEAIQDWQTFHNNTAKNTPVGFRLQFHQFAHTVFNRHPWIGNGTSGFSNAFKNEQPVPGWGPTLFEPHSQYWLIAVDWGILGLSIFLGFFFCLLTACWQRLETRPIAVGLIFSFLLGSFLDSLLLYASTGYFFLLFMALCLAGDTKPLPTSSIVPLIRDILQRVVRYKPRIS